MLSTLLLASLGAITLGAAYAMVETLSPVIVALVREFGPMLRPRPFAISSASPRVGRA